MFNIDEISDISSENQEPENDDSDNLFKALSFREDEIASELLKVGDNKPFERMYSQKFQKGKDNITKSNSRRELFMK